jgi:D-proline reductase (dithiol) PrdB
VQRAIEELGIPTVSVSMFRQVAVKLKLPRVVSLQFPFGFPLGKEESQQRQIIGDALDALTTISEPGSIIDLPYVWES